MKFGDDPSDNLITSCSIVFLTQDFLLFPSKLMDWFLYDKDLRHQRVNLSFDSPRAIYGLLKR